MTKDTTFEHTHGPPKEDVGTPTTNQSKKPGMRFNAYDDLISIRKREHEDIEGLIARVSNAMRNINDL